MFVASKAYDWSLAAAVARCGDGAVRSRSQWCWVVNWNNGRCACNAWVEAGGDIGTKSRRAVVGKSVYSACA